MKLYQYNLLDKTDHACVLWNKGVYLDTRTEGEHKILLYQVEGFYVEVFYDGDQNTIKRMINFINVGQLRPYLDKIDVSTLM